MSIIAAAAEIKSINLDAADKLLDDMLKQIELARILEFAELNVKSWRSDEI
jgi:hypothetical protein